MVSRGGGKRPDVLKSPLARELLAAPLMARLGTFARDGAIHLVPMWFVWNGRAVLIPTNHTTQKVRNLERDPRATVMVDDSRAGLDLRGVTLTGQATLLRGSPSLRLNRAIHLKYLTAAERDLPEVDAYLGTDDVTISIRPARAFTWDLRSSPAGRRLLETR